MTETLNDRQMVLLEGMDAESLRAKNIQAVRGFRSSWLDLARQITETAFGGDYKDWGYDEFSDYCENELGLNRVTVKKLMASYDYMKNRKPELIDAGAENNLPEYQTVAALRDLEARENVPADEIAGIREQVFAGKIDDAEARKKIRALRAEQSIPGMSDEREFQQLLIVAKKTRRLVKTVRRVPEGLAERIGLVLAEIEAL